MNSSLRHRIIAIMMFRETRASAGVNCNCFFLSVVFLYAKYNRRKYNSISLAFFNDIAHFPTARQSLDIEMKSWGNTHFACEILICLLFHVDTLHTVFEQARMWDN